MVPYSVAAFLIYIQTISIKHDPRKLCHATQGEPGGGSLFGPIETTS